MPSKISMFLDSIFGTNKSLPYNRKQDIRVADEYPYKQYNEFASKEASDAIKSEAIASININSDAKNILKKAYYLYNSNRIRGIYEDIMVYYKEAENEDDNQFAGEFGNITRVYDKKYDIDGNLIETRIYEYKDKKFCRESSVPADLTKPVVVSRQIGSDFEKCSYINGKLSEYVHGNYDSGKKEIEEIFEFRTKDGSVKSYAKNIKLNSDGESYAEQKFEFDEKGKLINFERNVKM